MSDSVNIRLFWSDFYGLMDEQGIDVDELENRLEQSFMAEFGVAVEIDWED